MRTKFPPKYDWITFERALVLNCVRQMWRLYVKEVGVGDLGEQYRRAGRLVTPALDIEVKTGGINLEVNCWDSAVTAEQNPICVFSLKYRPLARDQIATYVGTGTSKE